MPADAVYRWQDRPGGVLAAADAIAHTVAERVADTQSHRCADENTHTKPDTTQK